MVLSEVTEEERGRWLRLLVMFVLTGFIIAFTPELAEWITGIDFQNPPAGFPTDILNAIVNFFILARILGAGVMAAGGGLAAVKL
jgi:hypothetical protein